jgi:hypothetical protein
MGSVKFSVEISIDDSRLSNDIESEEDILGEFEQILSIEYDNVV